MDLHNSVENNTNSKVISVQNVTMRYNNETTILQNICMNVQTKTIYSLLGSSGCGKTTLLSCIVGLTKWQSGNILVFGDKPGSKQNLSRIGYMPQESALYVHLTIEEMINLYGLFYNLSETFRKKRYELMKSILDLPVTKTIIQNLSGGQTRRVSLALALLNSPDLLILDEPTVGLDPVLREKIWNHLRHMVTEYGTTIIVTTHYNEEARLSNTIGVLRDKRMIVEDSPENLLYTYNSDHFDDCIVKLCRKQKHDANVDSSPSPGSSISEEMGITFSSNWMSKIKLIFSSPDKSALLEHGVYRVKTDLLDLSENVKASNVKKPTESKMVYRKFEQNGFVGSVKNVFGLCAVLLLMFWRIPSFLGSVLFLPTMQTSLSLITMGSPMKNLHFGIVNPEVSDVGHICDHYIYSNNTCQLAELSCHFLYLLKAENVLILESHNSVDDALWQVQQGKTWGFLAFPSNYTDNFLNLVIEKRFATNTTLEGSRIHLHTDQSQPIAKLLFLKHIYNAYFEHIRLLGESCNVSTSDVAIPLEFRKPVHGSYEDDFSSFVLPGVITITLTACMLGGTSVLFLCDKQFGTLKRVHITGLTVTEILASHVIAQFIMSQIQIVILSAVLHFGFNSLEDVSYWPYHLICTLVGLFGIALGLFVGINCREVVEAMVVDVFLFLIFLFFGSIFIPAELMSTFWQQIGNFIPIKLPTLSLRAVIVQNFGCEHKTVWLGIGSTTLWILVLALLCLLSPKSRIYR